MAGGHAYYKGEEILRRHREESNFNGKELNTMDRNEMLKKDCNTVEDPAKCHGCSLMVIVNEIEEENILVDDRFKKVGGISVQFPPPLSLEVHALNGSADFSFGLD
ncbi:hypothetical protein Tco_0595891 [Tanacetum coccineum]